MRMRIRFDSIRSIDRATIDDGWMRLDRSIDRSVVRYGSSGIGVCVFRVFRVCDASIEDKKKESLGSLVSYRSINRIDRSIVSIDQPIDDRQTDRQTNGRTDPIHRSTRLDSTPSIDRLDSTRCIDRDDRRRPTTTDGPGRTARDGCASSSSSSSRHVVARGRGKEAR